MQGTSTKRAHQWSTRLYLRRETDKNEI